MAYAMIGILNASAIDAFLRSESIAHLACVLPDGRPYVVPMTYAFDGDAFYGYSADGMKLEALRAHPHVCLAVNRLVDAANWTSVVAWGLFRELADEDATDALRRISERLRTVATADKSDLAAQHTYVARTAPYGVVYRITISESTGRYSAEHG